MSLISRVFFQVVGRPFYRQLVLPLCLLMLVVVLADANTNWNALRDRIAERDPWEITILFTALFAFWGITAGQALRPVWGQPAIAFLVRQPIGRWQWVRYLFPSLSIAFLPLLGVWWLAPNYAQSPLHYVGFVGLVWTVILGGSYRGLAFAKWVAAGTCAVAAFIFLYAHQPIAALIAIPVAIALLPLSLVAIPDQIVRSAHVRTGGLTSITPTIAVIRRDFKCLWRLERKNLFGLLPLTVVTGLLMFAFRVNGHAAGRDAFVLSCVLLSVALLPIYENLTRLRTRLGPELMRRRWPIDHRHRAVALVSLTLLMAAPSILTLVLAGSTMGAAYAMLALLHAATIIGALSALFSQTLLVAAVSLGWSLWILLINTALAIALPPLIYAALTAIALPAAALLTTRGLRRFTQQTEIGVRE